MNKRSFTIHTVLAALLGFGIIGTASALPEVDVGSRALVGSNVEAHVQSDEPAEATAADEGDPATADNEA
jgi:hypothetical protein